MHKRNFKLMKVRMMRNLNKNFDKNKDNKNYNKHNTQELITMLKVKDM